MGTTGYSVYLARNKRFAEHRRWMKRSAALTFAAVTLRLMSVPMMIGGMTLVQTYNYTAWLSWIVPLAFVEWRMRSTPDYMHPVAAG